MVVYTGLQFGSVRFCPYLAGWIMGLLDLFRGYRNYRESQIEERNRQRLVLGYRQERILTAANMDGTGAKKISKRLFALNHVLSNCSLEVDDVQECPVPKAGPWVVTELADARIQLDRAEFQTSCLLNEIRELQKKYRHQPNDMSTFNLRAPFQAQPVIHLPGPTYSGPHAQTINRIKDCE